MDGLERRFKRRVSGEENRYASWVHLMRCIDHCISSIAIRKPTGPWGAAMILLLWFYVTGFAFLVGGEINAQIEHAAARHGHPEAKAPGEKAVSEEK